MENGNDILIQIARVEEREKSNTYRINEISDSLEKFQDETRAEFGKIREENKILYKLASSIETLSQTVINTDKKVDKIQSNQDKLDEKINSLEQAPAREALQLNKDIKKQIITMVVIGIVMFVLGMFFPFLA